MSCSCPTDWSRVSSLAGDIVRRIGIANVLERAGQILNWGAKVETVRLEPAQRVRRALEELGPTFVKLGQLLSSRPDLLPDVYITELSKLVDDVPQLPYEAIEPVIDREVGLGRFARIDREPLATASIAQIHTALLATGREVVVKVRRPGIVEQVELDLRLVREMTAGRKVAHPQERERDRQDGSEEDDRPADDQPDEENDDADREADRPEARARDVRLFAVRFQRARPTRDSTLLRRDWSTS